MAPAFSERRRARIAARAGERCEYCQAPESLCVARFHVDHIEPIALGGRSVDGNLAFACPACNRAKWSATGSVDPDTQRMVALYNPRRQQWGEHFA